jgi:hypothetical protein|tara:strand:+ start:3613 stop:3813 length:201 start_codon:yes stop_codon:yes gene_type:complete
MVLSWIIAILAITHLSLFIAIPLLAFVVIVSGIVLVKYFKFIFGYLFLFAFLGAVIYAGWFFLPLP